MEKITLNEQEIKILYKASNETGKSLMEEKYGKDFFSKKEWIELFASFCKKNNLTITHDRKVYKENSITHVYIPFQDPEGPEEEYDNASRMIRVIISLNNEKNNFKADYNNPNQQKWFPVFKMTSTGLVFSNSGYEDWRSRSYALVGAPFVSPTSKDAECIAKEFLPIYKKIILQ